MNDEGLAWPYVRRGTTAKARAVVPLGAAAPPVLWLYPSAPPAVLIPGRSQGVLGEGVATAADLVGPFAGQPLSVLVEALRTGGAYANVHTSQLTLRQSRGQID
jgi:hypothetical protein